MDSHSVTCFHQDCLYGWGFRSELLCWSVFDFQRFRYFRDFSVKISFGRLHKAAATVNANSFSVHEHCIGLSCRKPTLALYVRSYHSPHPIWPHLSWPHFIRTGWQWATQLAVAATSETRHATHFVPIGRRHINLGGRCHSVDRWKKVSWDEVRWDEMSNMNAPWRNCVCGI